MMMYMVSGTESLLRLFIIPQSISRLFINYFRGIFPLGFTEDPRNIQIIKEEQDMMAMMLPHVNVVKLLAVVEAFEGDLLQCFL